MIREGLSAFAGRTVLLLQGPMGPFFRRLAEDLRAVGARVHKVNFNAGDALFYPQGARPYRGTMADWPRTLEAWIDEWDVDVVLLFGDCRPVHRPVRDIVRRRGVELGVFEEGYVRPDYITLERHGVNGHSRLPRQPAQYRSLERSPPDKPQRVGNAYWHGVVWAILYATWATLGRPAWPHYRHHRPLGLIEALRWGRSAWRRWRCAFTERGLQQHLTGTASGRYFLVPLQVSHDAQIRSHSPYADVQAFICDVIGSFARHAPADTLLVLKHHPMDRAYADYARLIRQQAQALGLDGRCIYLHDQHLPSLLGHARGVVLINSTVGLQALDHRCAVKVCGTAIFSVPGLTYQGELDTFWCDAADFRPDKELFGRFHEYVVATTQINGSFYRRLRHSRLATGVRWSSGPVLDPADEAFAASRPADRLDHPSTLVGEF